MTKDVVDSGQNVQRDNMRQLPKRNGVSLAEQCWTEENVTGAL